MGIVTRKYRVRENFVLLQRERERAREKERASEKGRVMRRKKKNLGGKWLYESRTWVCHGVNDDRHKITSTSKVLWKETCVLRNETDVLWKETDVLWKETYVLWKETDFIVLRPMYSSWRRNTQYICLFSQYIGLFSQYIGLISHYDIQPHVIVLRQLRISKKIHPPLKGETERGRQRESTNRKKERTQWLSQSHIYACVMAHRNIVPYQSRVREIVVLL